MILLGRASSRRGLPQSRSRDVNARRTARGLLVQLSNMQRKLFTRPLEPGNSRHTNVLPTGVSTTRPRSPSRLPLDICKSGTLKPTKHKTLHALEIMHNWRHTTGTLVCFLLTGHFVTAFKNLSWPFDN